MNTLIYCMGDDADDVLRGLKLSATDQHVYSKVRDGFESFFIVRKNIVYECARFNMRKQEANENVDVFVTALHALAEHCNYGTLHDELIRDRIVVGLADARLSERMQMDQDLNLEKAINMARQSEEIKKQQNTLRNDASSVVQMDAATVDRVFEGRKQREKPKFNKYKSDGAKSHFSSQSRHPHNSQCYKCGGPPHHRHECPANDAKCHSCGKKGPFQRVCRAGENVGGIETEEEDESFFLGSDVRQSCMDR